MHYFKKFEEKPLWESGWNICVIPISAQIPDWILFPFTFNALKYYECLDLLKRHCRVYLDIE